MTEQFPVHTMPLRIDRNPAMLIVLMCMAFVVAFTSSHARTPSLEIGEIRNVATLNSVADDFAPRWAPWGLLYFNSERTRTSVFYVAAEEEAGLYSVRVAEEGLQSAPHHSSYIAFSPNNNAILGMYEMQATQPYMVLAEIGSEAGKWGQRAIVPALRSPQSFSGQPTLTPDGKTLAFVSDRAGGQGGTDIWLSKRTNEGWERCLPLDATINTSGNEVSPYLVSNDTLLFASNGAGGKGGYEILMSIKVAGVWQAPIPLQELNSEYDEFDPSLAPDGSLLFTSNRPGGRGGLDVYSARVKREQPQTQPLVLNMNVNASEIHIEDQVRTESFPLLPYVFYDRGSFEPRQPINIVNANPDFDPSAIRPGALNVYAELLNIVGFRMQNNPQAVLELTGCADGVGERENSALGRSRAEVIQRFLNRVWDIDTNRVNIRARTLPLQASSSEHIEGQAENRRVELRCTDSRILAPVVLTSQQQLVRPDSVRIVVDARPAKSLTSWKLHARTKTLGRFLSFEGAVVPDTVVVDLRRRGYLLTEDSLQWEYVSTDIIGRANTLVQPVPVRSSRVEYAANPVDSMQTYTLILFAFDEATLLREHEDMLSEIVARIPAGAEVLVTGYTDATGKAQHNRRLAAARAENVVQFCKALLPNVTFRTRVAAESELYDNRTPQGRFYSRTVQITF